MKQLGSHCASPRFLPGVLLLTLLSVTSQAHPGHDMLDHGPAHLVSSPYHLAVLSLTAIMLFAVAQFTRRPAVRRTLRFSAAVILLAATVLWTVGH
ncbi:MAG: hypothetical protein SFY81_16585 [Verrucomicrobiota bacterium]|nr:hypothetical protein [Verrucomicrobiota bacterium]